MISKAKIKWIKSLSQRKNRMAEGVFVAEGHKLVGEMMACSKPLYLCALQEWYDSNYDMDCHGFAHDTITRDELERVSLMRNPQDVVAVFPFVRHPLPDGVAQRELCLALDGIQDPGNLGTILRIADWFGICHVVCSYDTVDVYNPKVVQATMGALARVRIHYVDLPRFLCQCNAPVYGTLLDGSDIYGQDLTHTGVIVMGNEGNGISPEVRKLVDKRLLIPNYPLGSDTTDSLNVAVATAIVCSEFRRRQH